MSLTHFTMEYLKFFLFFQFITIYEHYTFCKKKKKNNSKSAKITHFYFQYLRYTKDNIIMCE